MTSIKTYMLVPHQDFPASGSLQLGGIILDPKEPGESLSEDDVIEIPATSRHSATNTTPNKQSTTLLIS
jgi:hypothetical protein